MGAIPDKQICTWGMACHLAGLTKYIGIPFGNIAGPLIIWLIKKNASPFVDDNGKESLNFQISLTIYGIVAANKGVPYRYPFTIRFIR